MSESALPSVSVSPDLGRPGHRLQAARQALGWSPEQVAEQLKWAPRQVLALESDDYQALPGMATVRGFVRAYAKLVKLDPAPLLAQLEPGSEAQVLPVRHDLAAPFSEVRLPSMHRRGLSGAHWAIGGALTLVLLVLLARQMGWLKPLPPDLLNRFAQSASATGSAVASANGSVAHASASEAASGAAVNANLPDNPTVSNNAPNNAISQASVPTALPGGGNTTTVAGANPVTAQPATGTATVTTPVAGTPAAATPVAVTPVVVTPVPAPAGKPPASPSNQLNPATNPTANQMANPAANPTINPTAAPVNAAPAQGNAGNVLVLKFKQDCWVEVKRVNGNVLLSRLIKAGETETVPMSDPVQLVVGNVAGVEASLRGAPLVLKNGPGNTARLTVK